MLQYPFPSHVEAFTTGKNEPLPYAVLQPHQVHLDKIVVVEDPLMSREELEGVDALVTQLKDFAIGVRTADCVPVLLYDARHQVVAAIHCGWRGTVQKLSQKCISLMEERFGTCAHELVAAIGPSISSDAFQVGQEVVDAFAEAGFPMHEIHELRTGKECISTEAQSTIPLRMLDGHHLDLWKANAWLLTEMGLLSENIHICGICTYVHADTLYSARKDGNQKGLRNINFIRIKP